MGALESREREKRASKSGDGSECSWLDNAVPGGAGELGLDDSG